MLNALAKSALAAVSTAVALLALTTGVALAEVEESEHYDSLAALTTSADAVVVGRVVSTAPGEMSGSGCGFTNATVRVESLVAGSLPAFATRQLTLRYFDCGTLPALGAEIPAGRTVFFLRNLRTDLRRNQPSATAAGLDAAWHFWALEIRAGSGVDRAGRVEFPVLDNADFLKPFTGMPFEQFVARVRSLETLAPDTATAPSGQASSAGPVEGSPAPVSADGRIWVTLQGPSLALPEPRPAYTLEIGGLGWRVPSTGFEAAGSPVAVTSTVPLVVRVRRLSDCAAVVSFTARPGTAWIIRFVTGTTLRVEDWSKQGLDMPGGMPVGGPLLCPRLPDTATAGPAPADPPTRFWLLLAASVLGLASVTQLRRRRADSRRVRRLKLQVSPGRRR